MDCLRSLEDVVRRSAHESNRVRFFARDKRLNAHGCSATPQWVS